MLKVTNKKTALDYSSAVSKKYWFKYYLPSNFKRESACVSYLQLGVRN